MPTTEVVCPACPRCHSTETVRMLFDPSSQKQPICSCFNCGHIWRLDDPAEPGGRAGKRQ
jgi:uncharacterized Zn finger protein